MSSTHAEDPDSPNSISPLDTSTYSPSTSPNQLNASGSEEFSGFRLGIFKVNTNASQDSTTKNSSNSKLSSLTDNTYNLDNGKKVIPLHSTSLYDVARRASVSSECINPSTFPDPLINVSGFQLTSYQLNILKKSLAQNFLFKSVDESALHLIFESLKQKKFKKGDIIIRQGDEGDYFYVVEHGAVEYSIGDAVVGQEGVGASFGELALMYFSPRAATVKATTDSILWALDRITFRRILLDETATKRQMYKEFLKEVPILEHLTKYQLSKLADALLSESLEAGTSIIKEGDIGDKFYIIVSGQAEVFKKSEGKVKNLTKASHFGEVALLNNLPRQATVIAKTKVSLVYLDKAGFERLLGPIADILKDQDPTRK